MCPNRPAADDPHYTFTYTLAHQLASMSHTDTNYRWQATPNCGANPDAVSYTHNGLNQYTAIASCNGAISASPAYDPNGNLTGDGAGWTYTYDAENRMATASATGTSASYLYDPLDHRSSKLVNSVYTFFLGDTQDDEIAEYSRVSDTDQTPVLLRRFVPGPAVDQPIAMVTAAAVRTYFHQNRQDSTIAMSRDDGTKSEGPFTYDPYGFVGGPTCTSSCALASGGEPFKFTGRRLDPETGLYYYRARYYSWQLGRFMQVDPIGTKDDLDLYTYVGNDPIDRTDPTGQVVQLTDMRDQKAAERMINSRARGTYRFDKHGRLEKVSSIGRYSQRSQYYGARLDAAIASHSKITVDIASTVTDPNTGKPVSVDGSLGGGATIGYTHGGDQHITISGRPNTSLKDTAGQPLRDTPADILMHEFVSHAIPHIVGSDTGNAVANENKARAEIPGGGQRAPESTHDHPE